MFRIYKKVDKARVFNLGDILECRDDPGAQGLDENSQLATEELVEQGAQ
jgi:hypothetical protein